ncbi:uncharacterized protein C8Q71DRAFT_163388 [Rhodofomes roseus]|uniref:Uncharacterized protein n=1 Tax=Rhodofomes roseus TaxID=34475 RepID=A0ABQ8K9U5_9APHY|nr:uncharacterized protein C8Q71DRAFT_163388 [Rhodofomes roseus]KAH9834151.1 hypothetical protein C8Q71DRAFT_163388 [Rhodofomes roseus]
MGVVRALIAEGGRVLAGAVGRRPSPALFVSSSILVFAVALPVVPRLRFRGLGSREFKSFHLNNPIYRTHPRRAPFYSLHCPIPWIRFRSRHDEGCRYPNSGFTKRAGVAGLVKPCCWDPSASCGQR